MQIHGQMNLTSMIIALLLFTGALRFQELRIVPSGVERIELRPT